MAGTKTTFIPISSGEGLAVTKLESDIANALQDKCGFPARDVRTYSVIIRRHLADLGYGFEVPLPVSAPPEKE